MIFPQHQLRFEEYGHASLFEGRFANTTQHANLAWCILVGLDRPLTISSGSGRTEGEAVVIAPGTNHAVDFLGGRSLLLYFEKPDVLSTLTKHCFDDGGVAPLGTRAATLLADHINKPLAELSARIEAQFASQERRVFCGVGRTLDVASLIRDDPFSRLSQFEGAAICGMERSTFLRNFKRENGMTFRSFKTWQAIKNAVVQAGKVQSIETAALDSGFYDAAHFSRTFRRVFGVSPSMATRHSPS
jgi:AraC-like DNA-binding protein